MPDREKVIIGLSKCGRVHRSLEDCSECPYKLKPGHYAGLECWCRLCDDALELLKEQEARVMALYEARTEYEIVWLDRKNISCEVAILQRIACSIYEFSIMGTDEMPSLLESQYGKTWRCWTSLPTPEQIWDTPWEGEKDAE